MHATVDIPSGPRVVLSGAPVRSVADYLARGGGQGLRSARSLGPWRTAEEVTLSGLRGRGGGGFRTGRKWLSVLDASRDDERRFVVGNGAGLRDIWGMSDATTMAALSLGVVALFALALLAAAIRTFQRTAVR